MRCLDLLLSLEEPQINFPRPQQYIIGILIKEEGGEPILRPIANFIEKSLDAVIGPNVPNLHHLICIQRYQMVPILIERQVLHTRVMAIEIAKNSQGKGVPHQDMPLLSATCHEPMFT
jgi:hypothetical protein